MENKFCFVIQPFEEIFDKRYEDIYDPAIKAAGLSPYRVDKDSSAKNLIEQIEKKIEEATICLADISEDNPNVWYELGYAFALGKDVVMVCDKQRKSFPFDVGHKSIIPYSNDSTRDFFNLEKQIKEKIQAYMCRNKIKETNSNSITTSQETSEMLPVEIKILSIVIGEQISMQDTVSIHTINQSMINGGFTNTATGIGIRLLLKKKLLESFDEQDWYGNGSCFYKLTTAGENFILSNLNLFELSRRNNTTSNNYLFDASSPVPF